MASTTTTNLFSLPDELLVDVIFLHYLTASDLRSLACVSRRLYALTSDEPLWRIHLQREFNFPAHATARRATGWKKLYEGLARTEVWTWGENGSGRLGIDVANLPDELKRCISFNQGAPFPCKVRSWKGAKYITRPSWQLNQVTLQEQQHDAQTRDDDVGVGTPVSLHAAGWMFAALTSTGNVLWWGTLRTMSQTDFDNERKVPHLLRMHGARAKLLSCGEHLVVLTKDEQLLSWSDIRTPIRLTGVFDMDDAQNRKVTQLESGGDFGVVLAEPRNVDAHDAHTVSSLPAVYLWFNAWTAVNDFEEQQQAQAALRRNAGAFLERPSEAVKLLELPLPPADLAVALATEEGITEEAALQNPAHRRITRVAAGENFLYVLTASGLIYKLHVERPRPPVVEAQDDEEAEEDEQARRAREETRAQAHIQAARAAFKQDMYRGTRAWVLLRGFCDPAIIERAGAEVWKMKGKEGLVSRTTRITHLSATFRSFVAYAPEARSTSAEAAKKDAASTSGLVLIGSSDAHESTEPQILPSLQGTGIIKVDLGDYHRGALDVRGRVRTWGDWSKGARGTWDSYEAMGDSERATRAVPTRGRGFGAIFRPFNPMLRRTQVQPQEAEDESDGAQNMTPLEKRCRWRAPQRHEEEPTAVRFFDLDEDSEAGPEDGGRFVFDIAMAGWHSGALSISSRLLTT